MFQLFKRVLSDCTTSANGDFDPARVVGYSMVLLTYLVWLTVTIYFVVTTGKFDSVAFCRDAATLSTMIFAAAAGVWIKKDTEVPTASGLAKSAHE
jgi:hypothetical protein